MLSYLNHLQMYDCYLHLKVKVILETMLMLIQELQIFLPPNQYMNLCHLDGNNMLINICYK